MQFCYPFLNPLTKWIDGVILHAKRWRHNMNNLHHTFGTLLDTHCNFQIWVVCIFTASGDISSFFGILNEIHWIKWYFLQMFVWFLYFFSSHLSIKIGKPITYSEGTSACMCLIWEGKGHFACWPNDSFGVKKATNLHRIVQIFITKMCD